MTDLQVTTQVQNNLAAEILANVLSLTSDPNIKLVLSKYDLSASDKTNQKSLQKCRVDAIKKAAQYLNYDEPVELLKDHLVDWIINRIKNLLPDTCQICESTYHSEFGTKPSVTCHTCGQGIHEDCYKANMNPLMNPLNIKGFHWFCNYCDSQLDTELKSIPSTQPQRDEPEPSVIPTQQQEAQIVQPQIPAGNETAQQTQDADNSQPIPQEILNHQGTQGDGQREPTNSNPGRPICRFYKKGMCKHGFTGKDCTFRHPKQCNKYFNHGTDQRLGCQLGWNCDKFHIIMCRTSITRRECYNENCKFLHCKGTKRQRWSDPLVENMTASQNQRRAAPIQQQTSQRPYDLHNIQDFPRLPNTVQPTSEPERANNAHFLGILSQIQQQLRNMESAQQQQAVQIRELTTCRQQVQYQTRNPDTTQRQMVYQTIPTNQIATTNAQRQPYQPQIAQQMY